MRHCSNLLNGITLARVTTDDAEASPGHANKRACRSSGVSASALGCSQHSMDVESPRNRTAVSDPMGREPFAWAANNRMKLSKPWQEIDVGFAAYPERLDRGCDCREEHLCVYICG